MYGSTRRKRAAVVVLLPLLGGSSLTWGGTLDVVSVSPTRHHLTAPQFTPISITFDRPVDPASVNSASFSAFGRWSGPADGTYNFSNGNETVTLTPGHMFFAGEPVMVVLSNALQAADSSPFRSGGYTYVFWTRTSPAPMTFTNVATLSNRTPPGNLNTRIYGAAASDLNHDGWPDLATVNEDSDDVRVFLNTGNPVAPYDTFLTPHPIGHEASPNEPADFNGDGHVDLCIASSSTGSVWVLLGNGDGTFAAPGQEISVGSVPHGIVVLDFDGDGDMDIANAVEVSDYMALLTNDGTGVFSGPITFDSGGDGEYALGTGDMNHDGIMDLVVGARNSQEAIILKGNGDGTFSFLSSQDAGGSIWMIAMGDVNGDGNMDVSSANSGSANGSILLGDGAGGLAAPVTYPTDVHAVATDLGDLDGDGDLDWVLSDFGGGIWTVYRNNGSGVYSFDQEFTAVSNPSCSIMLDFDNDRDLDLVLTDEIADLLAIERNGNIALLGDFDGDDNVDGDDAVEFAACITGPDEPYTAGCAPGDFDADGDIDCGDHEFFQAAWTAGGSAPPLEQCGLAVPAANAWGLLNAMIIILAVGSILVRRRAPS